jgi:DNA-binding NtrC family response regulator
MVNVRSASRTRILVVGNEPVMQDRSIASWLDDAGYQVADVKVGQQAPKLADQQSFDVVVVSVTLPGVAGVKAVRAASDNRLESKPVIVVGYPLMERAIEAVKLGAVDYLVGVQAPDDLEVVIRETLLQRESAQYIAGDNWWRA